MFHGWDSFYLLIGSGALGLIGLLFVVATLTAGREASTVTRGAQLYMTPTVFHLAVVLVVSAVTETPEITPPTVGIVLGACAVFGLIYLIYVGVEIARGELAPAPHWSDVWFYAVAPAVIYLGLAAVAVSAWRDPQWTSYGIALTMMALLLIAIRNAWDLVTWLAPRRDESPK